MNFVTGSAMRMLRIHIGSIALLGLGMACGSEQGTHDHQDPGIALVDGSVREEASMDAVENRDGVDDVEEAEGLDSGVEDVVSEGELPTSCLEPPSCDAAIPDLGKPRGFDHTSSKITATLGSPRHRGRDLFLLEGGEAWALGTFAYGVIDDAIKDEEVDIYLLRDCGSEWTFVGTKRTSKSGQNEPVHGVSDTGGRVYLRLSDAGIASLGRGRHRILMVLAGDLSYTEQFIEVVHPDAKIVVTDIDGTLTSSEYAALTDVAGLPPAQAHPGAAQLFWAFLGRGYHLFYLTARPEWMMPLTREWLTTRDFAPGVVHTTLSSLGASGSQASAYKSEELAWLMEHTGLVPSYGFGNKESDVQAYVGGGLDGSSCYYFGLEGDLQGGTSHSDYVALKGVAEQAPLACW